MGSSTHKFKWKLVINFEFTDDKTVIFGLVIPCILSENCQNCQNCQVQVPISTTRINGKNIFSWMLTLSSRKEFGTKMVQNLFKENRLLFHVHSLLHKERANKKIYQTTFFILNFTKLLWSVSEAILLERVGVRECNFIWLQIFFFATTFLRSLFCDHN